MSIVLAYTTSANLISPQRYERIIGQTLCEETRTFNMLHVVITLSVAGLGPSIFPRLDALQRQQQSIILAIA
jgi:hypothetical protein